MKPILVTGAAKGFGAAICKKLIAQGHDVVVHYRNSKEHSVSGVETIQGDFSSQEGVLDFLERYRKRFPHTKGIVNNIGNYLIAQSNETSQDDLHALFQTNFFAPFNLIQTLMPSIKAQKGSVVNIGTSGLDRALVKAPAYVASKSALLSYTRSLAKELAPDDVNVNMVSPGHLENSVDVGDTGKLPMKRAATLEEGAEIVAYLLSEKGRYITGQNIEVAGAFNL